MEESANMDYLKIYAVLAVCYFLWMFPHIHHHKLRCLGSIPAELLGSLAFACAWPWRFQISNCAHFYQSAKSNAVCFRWHISRKSTERPAIRVFRGRIQLYAHGWLNKTSPCKPFFMWLGINRRCLPVWVSYQNKLLKRQTFTTLRDGKHCACAHLNSMVINVYAVELDPNRERYCT